jgi:hypothetical protein
MMERNQKRSHLTVIDGNVYQIRNQKQNQLKQKFNLGNGVVVNPDGTYQKRIRNNLKEDNVSIWMANYLKLPTKEKKNIQKT